MTALWVALRSTLRWLVPAALCLCTAVVVEVQEPVNATASTVAEFESRVKEYMKLHDNMLGGRVANVVYVDEGQSPATGAAALDTLLKKENVLAVSGVVSSAVISQIRETVEAEQVPHPAKFGLQFQRSLEGACGCFQAALAVVHQPQIQVNLGDIRRQFRRGFEFARSVVQAIFLARLQAGLDVLHELGVRSRLLRTKRTRRQDQRRNQSQPAREHDSGRMVRNSLHSPLAMPIIINEPTRTRLPRWQDDHFPKYFSTQSKCRWAISITNFGSVGPCGCRGYATICVATPRRLSAL